MCGRAGILVIRAREQVSILQITFCSKKRDFIPTEGTHLSEPAEEREVGGRMEGVLPSHLLTDLDVSDRVHPDVDLLLKKVYMLAVLTGSDALILAGYKTGEVKSFATPRLEPLLTEKQGRSIIGALLTQKEETETANTPPVSAPEKPENSEEGDSLARAGVKWEEEDVDAAEYLENDQDREREFKTRFTQILNVVGVLYMR